jgi:hypothetical protein
MTVAVMVVVRFTLRHWHDTSVRHFAYHVLELDCSVVDAEAVMQAFFYIAQYALAD